MLEEVKEVAEVVAHTAAGHAARRVYCLLWLCDEGESLDVFFELPGVPAWTVWIFAERAIEDCVVTWQFGDALN